jgi:hypothetical protein
VTGVPFAGASERPGPMPSVERRRTRFPEIQREQTRGAMHTPASQRPE